MAIHGSKYKVYYSPEIYYRFRAEQQGKSYINSGWFNIYLDSDEYREGKYYLRLADPFKLDKEPLSIFYHNRVNNFDNSKDIPNSFGID